jgi:hypothetical protein
MTDTPNADTSSYRAANEVLMAMFLEDEESLRAIQNSPDMPWRDITLTLAQLIYGLFGTRDLARTAEATGTINYIVQSATEKRKVETLHARRVELLRRMLAGELSTVQIDDVRRASIDASANRDRHGIGFSIIGRGNVRDWDEEAAEHYDDEDWHDYFVLMTDGQRECVIMAGLSSVRLAAVTAASQDVGSHLVEQLHRSSEELEPYGIYEQLVLNVGPIRFA